MAFSDDERHRAVSELPDSFYLALGWMHAEACTMLDNGEDPRHAVVPELAQRACRDCHPVGFSTRKLHRIPIKERK